MPRLFQNFDVYPTYLKHFHRHTQVSGYDAAIAAFLEDRFIALHMLKPTLEGSEDACFSVGNDPVLQRYWASMKGMGRHAAADDILLAQIEEHRTEIFYNHDPVRFGSDFVRRLPACVRSTVAWRAAPSRQRSDFGEYDLIVCNFPSILQSYRDQGWRTAWFAPAFDPSMADFAAAEKRTVDVLFVGTHSQYHTRRTALIERLADLGDELEVSLCLQLSRTAQLANTPAGWFGPLRQHRLPHRVRHIRSGPVFGLDLYAALASAKIVLNCAVDMAGDDRGNMRCWEALGCRSLLLSDAGDYPPGMVAGETLVTYDDPDDMASKALGLIADPDRMRRIADAGHEMVKTAYCKDRQWADFLNLL
jgi:hypothetical protein